MKIILSPHNGCGNHGCEAIVRSTVAILDIPKPNISLYTLNPESDIRYGLNDLCEIVPDISAQRMPSSVHKKIFALKERISGKSRDLFELSHKYSEILKFNGKAIALSIGGDNFCYRGMQHILSEHLEVFSHNKIQSVLWGCSVEEKYLSEKAIGDLKRYSIITARESLTQQILADVGIIDNVISCSDPAFTLSRQSTDWHNNLMNSGNVIGINISDMMNKYDSYQNATYKNFYNLIDYILKNTDSYIALIPHVRQQGNDDLKPIKEIAAAFNNERILVADEDFNCMQLKDIISKCRMFVGCRTHSTIAAYSTCVPTFVVGYSIKARGICQDIFSTQENLLTDVREFKTDNDLTNQFIEFAEKENELRKHLIKTMPDYINRAYNASEALKQKFGV